MTESWVACVTVRPDGKTSEVPEHLDSSHLPLSSLKDCKEWIADAKRTFPRRISDGMITHYWYQGEELRFQDYSLDGTPLS